ncbi:MAG TPA: AraC family transcriptional regulator ligand-binding domain-containing protein [Halioglobus sp.]
MGDSAFFSLDGPLDSMPANRQMRIANLAGFPGLVRSRGADPNSLLERHGIDPQVIRDPDQFVDCKSVVDLFEYCSTSLGDPLFGLHLARIQNPDVFGCVTALCRSAATVRESVVSFIDYIPVIHAPDTILQLVESRETAEIRWSVGTDLGSNHQANYQAALLNLKLLQMVGGQTFRPSYVNLAVDARSRDIDELEHRLGCTFNRTKSENAIAFPVSVLDQCVTSSNRLLFQLLGGYLEQVKAASRTAIADRVQDYIRGALASRTCSIERCARKLGIPVRTLQAHLSDAGLNFSDILEQQRMELAKTCLAQDHCNLDDVAAMLGYAEQSSFGRAFKRWTGLSPRQFRQNSRSLSHS